MLKLTVIKTLLVFLFCLKSNAFECGGFLDNFPQGNSRLAEQIGRAKRDAVFLMDVPGLHLYLRLSSPLKEGIEMGVPPLHIVSLDFEYRPQDLPITSFFRRYMGNKMINFLRKDKFKVRESMTEDGHRIVVIEGLYSMFRIVVGLEDGRVNVFYRKPYLDGSSVRDGERLPLSSQAPHRYWPWDFLNIKLDECCRAIHDHSFNNNIGRWSFI